MSDLTSDPPARETARDLVAGYLRRAIVTGELEPGAKLKPSEFAERLDVSPTPTREAFQLLASEGLLRIDPYKETRVTELSADEYEEIYLMRVGLEGLAARLGAERIDEPGIERMRELLQRLEDASDRSDVGAFLEADREFHATHYRASARESLWARIIALRFSAERYTRVAYQLPTGGMVDTVETHSQLLAAVERRDGSDAQAIIEADLERTYVSLVGHLRAQAKDSHEAPEPK